MKTLARRLLARTETGRRLLLCHGLYPYLDSLGWPRSAVERRPVDRDGEPLPWYTYPAISFLAGRVGPGLDVFEFGSGQSTLWWARRARRVVSVEHDPDWHRAVRSRLPDNVDYRHVELAPDGEYARTVLEFERAFDVIVVDGRDRVNCARHCLTALREGGVVVWDNSERERYEPGYARLAEHGFRRLDFDGHGPVNDYGWRTTVFYRPDNCLRI